MELNEMNLKQIEERKAAIDEEVKTADVEGIKERTKELEGLMSRKAELEKYEARKADEAVIKENPAKAEVIERKSGTMEKELTFGIETQEYREAYFKKLQRKELSEFEQRAFTSTTAAAVLPTQTSDMIITKLKEVAPLLNEITLLQVAGSVKFAYEGANADAAIHTENAAITAASDTMLSVTLGSFEVCKLIQISDTVSTMSINAFEGWLVEMLVEKIANALSNYIINGTGSSEPTGIEKANTWGATNSVTVAKADTLTNTNILAVIGLLGGGYDANAKFIMSKSTLFNDFMPLKDSSKNDLVVRIGKDFFVYGYPVLIDSRVTAHEFYLGDLKKVVGNLPESVSVKSGYDIDTNSNKYLGVAMFDCKPVLGEAFVKAIKATV